MGDQDNDVDDVSPSSLFVDDGVDDRRFEFDPLRQQKPLELLSRRPQEEKLSSSRGLIVMSGADDDDDDGDGFLGLCVAMVLLLLLPGGVVEGLAPDLRSTPRLMVESRASEDLALDRSREVEEAEERECVVRWEWWPLSSRGWWLGGVLVVWSLWLESLWRNTDLKREDPLEEL
mmetsp:Transcript_27700/g.58045  ORF Transcript_27700/g.58045 Transcript_27700/m.58045 type:complete len:175 (+) Transcript_27700:36-560(+)